MKNEQRKDAWRSFIWREVFVWLRCRRRADVVGVWRTRTSRASRSLWLLSCLCSWSATSQPRWTRGRQKSIWNTEMGFNEVEEHRLVREAFQNKDICKNTDEQESRVWRTNKHKKQQQWWEDVHEHERRKTSGRKCGHTEKNLTRTEKRCRTSVEYKSEIGHRGTGRIIGVERRRTTTGKKEHKREQEWKQRNNDNN